MLVVLGFVEIISLWHKGVLRGVFLANHLASIENLPATTERQNTYKHKLTLQQQLILINNKIHTQKAYANRKDGQHLV